MGESPVGQVCPVCGTPEELADFCAVCRWRLGDDPVLGELTADDVDQARSALQAASHSWDVRAALRAARAAGGGPGEQVSAVLRAGPLRPGEKVSTDPPDEPRQRPGLHPAKYADFLDDLFRHRVKELLFMEFTPDAVNLVRATLGDGGIPVQADAGTTQWHAVTPILDKRPDLLRFQLAGGIGTLPAVSRTEFETAVLRWLENALPGSYEHSLVLFTPCAGWVLLERAAAAVRTACTPRAELVRTAAGTTADAVRDILRTAPLPADHTLLLARADPRTGALRPHPHVLFPAGLRLGPGETATADVTVYGGVGDTGTLTLPVFAGTPAADGTGAAPLAAHEVAVGALERLRLRFELRGPGEVGLLLPAPDPSHRPAGAAVDVPALIARLPRRIVRPPRLEVYFTVELSGADRSETEERLRFVRDFVTALAQQHGRGAALRTGAVGHYDHGIRENAYASGRTLLLPVPAGPATDTLTALGTWQPARRQQDTASSLEDALRAVPGLASPATTAAEQVRRVVLIVGRRPPGLPGQHGTVPACPLGADWRAELAALRAAGFQVMARADPGAGPPPHDHPGLAARRYADTAWEELGREGRFHPGRDSAADVVKALLPPWRQDGPPCRLAFADPLI